MTPPAFVGRRHTRFGRGSRPHPTLRRSLTLPYVALVLLTASVIGFLSYRAAGAAIDTLSDLVLEEAVGRVLETVKNRIADSDAVLEIAAPDDSVPGSSGADFERLRERFRLVTAVHGGPNAHVYYGDRRGRFISLRRRSESEAELRARTDPDSPGEAYRLSSGSDPSPIPIVGSHVPDPRDRSWFRMARGAEGQRRTIIRVDPRTGELVGTRARRVNDADGRFEGVVATDVSLRRLSDFLATLALGEHGVALVAERGGRLLATSRETRLREGAGSGVRRANALRGGDPLIAATRTALGRFVREGAPARGIATSSFEGPDGTTVRAGFARLRNASDPQWIVAVATPREPFMRAVTDNARRTAILTLLACALAALIGPMALRRLSGDLHRLARTARRMGDGDLAASVSIGRTAEVGELAQSFVYLQSRLLTDRLTGIANRSTILRKLEDRVIRHSRGCDERPFALLFIDLDRIEGINDRFGHAVGDRVLMEVSLRLARSVRREDVVARFGGDEFVVLLDEIANRADAQRIAAHLQTVLARRYETLAELSDQAMLYSRGASIGIALWPDDGSDVETLLKRAHEKMYTRKTGSRSLPSVTPSTCPGR